jgi:hypothetical protein
VRGKDVDQVQQFPKLAPGVVQVADHPVLAPTDLPVFLAQSGDACPVPDKTLLSFRS